MKKASIDFKRLSAWPPRLVPVAAAVGPMPGSKNEEPTPIATLPKSDLIKLLSDFPILSNMYSPIKLILQTYLRN